MKVALAVFAAYLMWPRLLGAYVRTTLGYSVWPRTGSARQCGPSVTVRRLATSAREWKTRIAFCVDTFDVGGTELNALRLARHLHHRGVRIEVCAMKVNGPLREGYESAGIPVHSFPFHGFASMGAAEQVLRLRRHLRANRIDIAHCHDYYSNVFGGVATFGAAGPLLVTSRRWSTSHPPKHMQRLNRWINNQADCVLANSPRIGAEVVRDDHVPAERVAVVPNFVEPFMTLQPAPGRRDWWRRRFGLPADAVAVGCASRLAPVKNFTALIDAVAQLPPHLSNVHVLLIGDGTCSKDLLQQAARVGLTGRVHITGLQSTATENPQGTLDILVLPSLSEGFPNAVLEGMAAGVAVVASNVGGVPDVVVDRVTGLLVPPGSVPALADALQLLLTNTALRGSLAAAGRELVAAEHTADAAVHRLLNLYATLSHTAYFPDPLTLDEA